MTTACPFRQMTGRSNSWSSKLEPVARSCPADLLPGLLHGEVVEGGDDHSSPHEFQAVETLRRSVDRGRVHRPALSHGPQGPLGGRASSRTEILLGGGQRLAGVDLDEQRWFAESGPDFGREVRQGGEIGRRVRRHRHHDARAHGRIDDRALEDRDPNSSQRDDDLSTDELPGGDLVSDPAPVLLDHPFRAGSCEKIHAGFVMPDDEGLSRSDPDVRDTEDRLRSEGRRQQGSSVVEPEGHRREPDRLRVTPGLQVGLRRVDRDRSADRADGGEVAPPDQRTGLVEGVELPADERAVVLVDRREEGGLVDEGTEPPKDPQVLPAEEAGRLLRVFELGSGRRVHAPLFQPREDRRVAVLQPPRPGHRG